MNQTKQIDTDSLFTTLKNNLNESSFKSSGAREFTNFIDTMRQFASSARISEIVNRVTVESGYEQYIRELGDEERLENLSEFKRIANEFEERSHRKRDQTSYRTAERERSFYRRTVRPMRVRKIRNMRNTRFLFLLFLQTRIPMARTHIFFSAYKNVSSSNQTKKGSSK